MAETLFEYSPVPLWEFDLSAIAEELRAADYSDPESLFSRVVLCRANRAALDLYGLSSVSELVDALPSIISQESFADMLPGMTALAHGHESFETETTHNAPDGHTINLMCRISGVPDHDPPLGCVILSTVDVTPVREMTEQLELLSLLPEANPNIVLILSCRQEIIYANPAAHAWLQSAGGEESRALFRLLPPDMESVTCGSCDDRTAQTYTVEDRGRVYDAKIRPLDKEERCMVTLTDVTEFERVSQERELYYQAFSVSRNPIFITDTTGNIVYTNPEFVRQYGIDPQQSGPVPASKLNPGREVYQDLGITQEEYDAKFADLWDSVRDGSTGFWAGEMPNRRADGSIAWVHLYVNAVRSADGGVDHYLGIPVDISEDRARERAIRLDIYRAITALAETRDNETGLHINRVGRFARMLAERLGQSTKFCEDIEVFAPLHDIGKVGISDGILLAKRRLTQDEFEVMKTHTILGYKILADKEPLRIAAEIVYGHHEKWDGSGYPLGRASEEIPLSARIVAVVDVYDALRSTRPYKEAWPHDETMREIQRLSGSHFDPDVVAAFIELGSHVEELFAEMS